MTPPVALTIAGSDSGGGAGIQADLATFAAFGVFGTSAITAVTAQNTIGVAGVEAVSSEFVVEQVNTVLADFAVGATKTGMLAGPKTLVAVADLAAAGHLNPLVVDPVMVATSGDPLLPNEAIALYRENLFPHAQVVTPNLAEAGTLLDSKIESLGDMHDAARELARFGPHLVVVTGGHAISDRPGEAVDVAFVDGSIHEVARPRVDTSNDHGTGCSLSAAIAAALARGEEPLAALHVAAEYVHSGLSSARGWRLGQGRGPLDHLRGSSLAV